MTMHHIVVDAWSIGVLIRELAELYAAYSQGRDSSLAELPIQYADYAVWQKEWLAGTCSNSNSTTGSNNWRAPRLHSICPRIDCVRQLQTQRGAKELFSAVLRSDEVVE